MSAQAIEQAIDRAVNEPPAMTQPRARILIAEDNDDMRHYLSCLLEGRHEVIQASDGEMAWRRIEDHRPDLVLTDVMMPILDGMTLLRRIRQLPGGDSMPVILLSARADEADRIRGMDAGADDYLIKPFSAAELIARINAHLKLALQRRMNQELLARRNQELEELSALRGELLQRVNQAQEAERRRVALALNESLGQCMAALMLGIGSLKETTGDPAMAQGLQRLRDIATEADQELERLVASLRPTLLDDHGLGAAVPDYVASWSREAGVASETLVVDIEGRRFGPDIESTVYRVVQTSLAEVARRASTSQVHVTLACRRGELSLSLEEEEDGAVPSPTTEPDWQRTVMAERAEALGGRLMVETQPAGGMTVLLNLPLREWPKDDENAQAVASMMMTESFPDATH